MPQVSIHDTFAQSDHCRLHGVEQIIQLLEPYIHISFFTKKFGMTFQEIGPKRECQNFPRRKLINIPIKFWQLILISQKIINFGPFRQISVKFHKNSLISVHFDKFRSNFTKIINLIYYIKSQSIVIRWPHVRDRVKFTEKLMCNACSFEGREREIGLDLELWREILWWIGWREGGEARSIN